MIVSAQQNAADQIRGALLGVADVDLVLTAANGSAALRALAAHQIDLVFLDAELPQCDHLGFGDLAGQAVAVPHIVLVADHETQACKAFDIGATDFLTQPICKARLETALARVARAKRLSEAEANFARVDRRLKELSAQYFNHPADDIWVQRRSERIRIDLHRVTRVVAEGEYVRLFVDGMEHLHRESLTSIMTRLDPDRMIRIHRSFAVQRADIATIRRLSGGSYQAIMVDGSKLPIGRTYRAELCAMARQVQ
jgi:DNA-binding LytR/AlgR family response regulator